MLLAREGRDGLLSLDGRAGWNGPGRTVDSLILQGVVSGRAGARNIGALVMWSGQEA